MSITRGATSGSMRVNGVTTCGQMHECFVCRNRELMKRAIKLVRAIAEHRARGGTTELLTLTLRRPRWNPSLAHCLDAQRDTWLHFSRSTLWQELLRDYGAEYVMALEETVGFDALYSETRWHVHRHLLLFLPGALDDEQREALRTLIAGKWAENARTWAGEQWEPRTDSEWSEAKQRRIGVGVDLAPSTAAHYLTKLGLEIAGGATKRARESHRRSMVELLAMTDHAEKRAREWAWRAWREWVVSMKGAKILTASGWLRHLEDADESEEHELLVQIPRDAWAAISRRVEWIELMFHVLDQGRARELARELELAGVPRRAVRELRAFSDAREHVRLREAATREASAATRDAWESCAFRDALMGGVDA